MNCRRKQYSLKDFSEHRECETVRGEDRNQSLAALRQKEEEESERRFREDKRKTQMPGAADQWEKGFHALLVQGNVFRFVVRVLLFFISAYIAVNLFSLICLIGKSTGIIRWIVIGLVVFLTAGLVYCVVGVLRLFRELPKFQQVSKGTMDEKEQKPCWLISKSYHPPRLVGVLAKMVPGLFAELNGASNKVSNILRLKSMPVTFRKSRSRRPCRL